MPTVMNGVSLNALTTVDTWSALSLFANGEQGAWYDPSDMSTMFQDAAGTIPVTAVEQPVGLILDKSKRLALGSELVTNGDFSNGTTGWSPANANITIAVVGGVGEMTSSVANIYVAQTVNVTSGKTYIVTGQGRAGTAPLLPLVVSGGVVLGTQINSSASLQPISFIFVAGAATASLRFQVQSGSGGTAYFDNISVKEIAGNHASQSTSASRPVLSARHNLLTRTEEFDNATAWAKYFVAVPATKYADPYGGTTANLLYPTAATTDAALYRGGFATVGKTHSYAVKAAGKSWFCILKEGTSGGAAWFNLSTGFVGTVAAGYAASDPVSLGNGWYRCTVTSTSGFSQYTAISAVDADNSTTPTPNGTDGVYIWGADLRVTNDGVGIPAYQRVGAAVTGTSGTISPPVAAVTGVPDYDTNGFPLYLRFDGTDDCLATATINPGGDKLQVFAGVRKIAGTAFQAAVGYGFTTAGSFYLYAPTSVKADYGFYATGNTGNNTKTTDATFTPPISSVVSGFVDGALAQATQVTGRVNGSSAALSAGGAMTLTSIGADKINLGRRQNSDLPFNGNLYSIIFRFGANLSDAQIASTETYVNNLTKAY